MDLRMVFRLPSISRSRLHSLKTKPTDKTLGTLRQTQQTTQSSFTASGKSPHSRWTTCNPQASTSSSSSERATTTLSTSENTTTSSQCLLQLAVSTLRCSWSGSPSLSCLATTCWWRPSSDSYTRFPLSLPQRSSARKKRKRRIKRQMTTRARKISLGTISMTMNKWGKPSSWKLQSLNGRKQAKTLSLRS